MLFLMRLLYITLYCLFMVCIGFYKYLRKVHVLMWISMYKYINLVLYIYLFCVF